MAWISGRVESLSQSPSGSASPGHPRLVAIDLLGQDEDSDVPVRAVSEHAGDGPVLVDRRGERGVVQTFDERAETLALAGVLVDVGAIVRHRQPSTA